MSAFAFPPQEGEHAASVPVGGAGARRRKPVRLPAARMSEMLLIRIAPRDTGLFRYLMEGGGGHLVMLTVLDPRKALFKLLFSPHQREEVEALLESMRKTVPFDVENWPFPTEPDGGSRRTPSTAGAGLTGPEEVLQTGFSGESRPE